MKNKIVGQLVAQDYRNATVFEKYKIDFCCNGNRTIKEVCEQKGIDEVQLIKELEQLSQLQDADPTDYNLWPIDKLAGHIAEKHHRYVDRQIPVLKAYLKKISSVHGAAHPELFEIATLFDETAEELAAHMQKEERMLFPQVQKMVQAKKDGGGYYAPPFGSFQNPIAVMMHEHAAEGERFAKMDSLSNNYTVPADGCNTYHVTFSLLKEFETDLHLHLHLENNILFPKAIAMENS